MMLLVCWGDRLCGESVDILGERCLVLLVC